MTSWTPLLSTQYRKPMNFSQKLLQDTEKMYYKFSKIKDNIKIYQEILENKKKLNESIRKIQLSGQER